MNPDPIASLRGRESEAVVFELLALAQIHRSPGGAASRGANIAAEYANATNLQLYGYLAGGVVVGVVGIEESESGAIIRDLAVAPGARRQGIGRALVRYLRGRFDLLEGDTLEPAVDFYRACGFAVLADGAMPDGRTRYRLTWRR